MLPLKRLLESTARRVLGLNSDRFKNLMASRGHFGTRQYHRHDLHHEFAGYLEFGNHKLTLVNLSFGGVSIIADPGLFLNLFQSGGRFTAKLTILGISRRMTFAVAYILPENIGLRLAGSNREDEKFFRSLLYFLDAGLVLQSLSKQDVPSFFKSPNWHSYSTENREIEVHLNINIQGVLTEAHVISLEGLRQEIAIFGKRGITISISPKKQLSMEDKKRILRNSLLVILGLRQIGNTDRFDRLITSGITRLLK